ncbi:hypothetical protein MED121_20766 [Marinomonas sp. MED121]|uniref:DUF2589 domain-containing protein n=1 Tax=Marinomonas sp. MED121 TaxID=314277 RepID=UPI00006909D9|nr:DUF2589 domain-containing protein [Marinomonas sp. MED121]EAQ64041.1 hypothetical protein MED121_20766 [Marinomonas sp. MED121]
MSGSNLSLQNLVEAIMNSIADAQDQIEKQTLDNINEWFDEDGRPKMVSFKVPSLHPDDIEKQHQGEPVEREVNIPLLTLMQKNPIKIKRLLAKFEITLGSVQVVEDEEVKGKRKMIGSETTKKIRKVLSTDLFTANGKDSARSRQASMEIEFESSEPTEAFLKLQNDLLKLF